MRRALVAAVVLAALVVGAALWAIRDTADDADMGSSATADADVTSEVAAPRVRQRAAADGPTGTAADDAERDADAARAAIEKAEKAAPAVAGVVVADESGAPVGGARVGVVGHGDAAVRTGPDGRFRMPYRHLRHGMRLRVATEGRETRWAPVDEASDRESIEVRLRLGGRVEGAVRDRDGRPVARAEVFLVPADARGLLDQPESWTIGGGSGFREALRGTETTGASGAYAVDGLALDATYLAIVRAPGHATSEPLEVRLTSAAPRQALDLTVRRPGALDVTVVTSEGAAVPAAHVTLAHGRADETTVETDLAGRVLAEGLEPGGWVVTVRTERHGMLRRAVRVEEGETRPLEMRLAPTVAIAGVLVGADGAPRGGTRVVASRPAWEDAYSGLQPSEGEAVTGADGTFRIEGLLAGPHLLEAREGRGDPIARADAVAAPAAGVRLVARAVASLRVRLVVRDDPPEWHHALRVSAGGVEADRMWNRGHIALSGIAPGRSTVRIVGPFLPIEREVEFVAGETVDLGEIAPDPGHDLRGRVVDSAGRGVAAADVATPTFSSDPAARSDRTREDGSFVLRHLAADEHSVEVFKRGFLPATARLRAGPAEAPGTIVLSRGAVLRGVVVRRDGTGAPGASVHVFDPAAKQRGDPLDGREAWPRTDARGAFECRLHAGRYRIDVEVKTIGRPVVALTAEVELGGEGDVRDVRIEAAE